jgi:hypothetical protein
MTGVETHSNVVSGLPLECAIETGYMLALLLRNKHFTPFPFLCYYSLE